MRPKGRQALVAPWREKEGASGLQWVEEGLKEDRSP